MGLFRKRKQESGEKRFWRLSVVLSGARCPVVLEGAGEEFTGHAFLVSSFSAGPAPSTGREREFGSEVMQ